MEIRIVRKNDKGEMELLWKVSPSRDHGEPRQLAYKLDTIVINRRLDDVGHPLPKMVRLGSLSQLCRELGVPPSGKNINDFKTALLQNASAFITARLSYKAADGTQRRLEADFSRYSLRFYGETLPNGRKADAVYIVLNNDYWEVLNNAPLRPQDRDYMRGLPPAGQRFYELLSYQIFAAFKHRRPQARLRYSEYCTFAPQQRYFELWKAKRQMTPIHRQHLTAGYIDAVRYEAATDDEGMPDWFIWYTPGPKARAEFVTYTRKGAPRAAVPNPGADDGVGETPPVPTPVSTTVPPGSQTEHSLDATLLAELTRRGIAAVRARKILSNLAEPQEVADQLEWWDYLLIQNPGTIKNPPGLLISLLEANITVPETFQTSRKRRLREEVHQVQEHRLQERAALELAWERYKEAEIDRQVEQDPERFQQLLETKKQKFLGASNGNSLFSVTTLQQIATGAARAEIARLIPFLTFEAFCDQERQRQQAPASGPPPSGPEQGRGETGERPVVV